MKMLMCQGSKLYQNNAIDIFEGKLVNEQLI